MNKWKWILYSLFSLNLGIILFFWWNSSSNLFSGDVASVTLALGRICGLLAVFFILLQFVMRGRAVWVEEVFGLNNLATAHRLNGYLSLSFIISHFLLILTSYSLITGKNSVEQLIDFITNYDDLFKAFIALLLFISIVFFSIYIVKRKLKYETWYYIHLFTYLAILFAWGHQLELGGDFAANKIFVLYWYLLYAFVFGNLLFFRFFRQGYLFVKYQFKVAEVVRETNDAISIYITGNNISKFKIQPGQFLILRFLDKKRWWQTHPFSLSFIPKDNLLRVTIKDEGDFTSEVSKIKKGTPILIDGPLGTFTAKSAIKDKFLFIAGGVGITPIRSLIEEIGELKKDIILIYSSKTLDMIFKKELDELSVKYRFIIHYVVTEDPRYNGEKGRLDKEKLNRLAPDFLKRDIYLCGPPAMMENTIRILKNLGVNHALMHYERFSL